MGRGGAGYIGKESCGADLFKAIRDVAADRRYLTPLLSETLTRRYFQKSRTILMRLSPALTTRERKVLQLVLEGESNSALGARLNITLSALHPTLPNRLCP